jgi:chromosome segregation ATPase
MSDRHAALNTSLAAAVQLLNNLKQFLRTAEAVEKSIASLNLNDKLLGQPDASRKHIEDAQKQVELLKEHVVNEMHLMETAVVKPMPEVFHNYKCQFKNSMRPKSFITIMTFLQSARTADKATQLRQKHAAYNAAIHKMSVRYQTRLDTLDAFEREAGAMRERHDLYSKRIDECQLQKSTLDDTGFDALLSKIEVLLFEFILIHILMNTGDCQRFASRKRQL